MEINALTEKEAGRWEEFVSNANNGTIFHTLKFLSYHPQGRFKSHHLMIKEKDSVISVFPAVKEGKTIISHKGASYGGFVMKEGVGIQETCFIVEHLIRFLKAQGYQKIVLTQPPLIYYNSPNQYIDFALMKNGFCYIKREITAVIPFSDTEPLLSFDADARRSTKKAIREGVKIKISEDFNAFYKILRQNLGMRHNVSPTHTLSELLRLKKLFPDDIILFGAFLKDKMIGGIVIFSANPRVLLAFYISHNNKFQIYRPVNLLFYEIIKWGRSKNFKYLDLGTFTLNMEPFDYDICRTTAADSVRTVWKPVT